MSKDFLKPFFWAIGLHGGVLGILLFSWPFLAQSVFSFDRSRVFRVSLVSPHLLSPALPGETLKNGSAKKVEPQKTAPFFAGAKPAVQDLNLSPGPSRVLSVEDQGGKKETISAGSFSSQVPQAEREKGLDGQNPSAGKGKELSVSFPSAGRSSAGSTLAIPRYGQNREPYYPAAAREQGWQGTALLKVLVLKNGSVGSLEILRSSGYAILDRSALKSVKEWKFVPAQKDGQPIEIGVEVPVTFRLE